MAILISVYFFLILEGDGRSVCAFIDMRNAPIFLHPEGNGPIQSQFAGFSLKDNLPSQVFQVTVLSIVSGTGSDITSTTTVSISGHNLVVQFETAPLERIEISGIFEFGENDKE